MEGRFILKLILAFVVINNSNKNNQCYAKEILKSSSVRISTDFKGSRPPGEGESDYDCAPVSSCNIRFGNLNPVYCSAAAISREITDAAGCSLPNLSNPTQVSLTACTLRAQRQESPDETIRLWVKLDDDLKQFERGILEPNCVSATLGSPDSDGDSELDVDLSTDCNSGNTTLMLCSDPEFYIRNSSSIGSI
ncbi:unnamed protein product [Orchesella dallaii]|uniref:Uncharacterized protein n=1 Tax=Orchesella dallaii TaxID=48710 RepID=A0ABP1PZR6_9HEXA